MSKRILPFVIAGMARICLAGASFHSVLPPRFEENAGQAVESVRFLVHASGFAAAFERDGTVVYAGPPGTPGADFVEMKLLGGNDRPTVAGEGDPEGSRAVYHGGFGALGRRLQSYPAIRYRKIYAGIDWEWHFRESALEFQFELSPGADPAAIRLAFQGSSGVRLDQDGNLEVEGGVPLRYRRPEAWQEVDGGRIPVPVTFRVDAGTVSFDVGSYDHTRALTIDPVVRYSREFGGAGYDAANGVAVDAAGYVYVTGETGSVDFTSSKGIRYIRAAFVSKLSPDATQLLYTAMLTSNGNTAGKAIALDAAGNIWIAGVAGGPAFPVTSGAVRTQWAGAEDAFIARLTNQGVLTYGSYLGGGSSDAATGLALDSSGNVYVTGYTASGNFPTTAGAPQTILAGGTDAFLVKLNPAGTSMVYATLLGGAGNDQANGVAVDGAGNACIAGRTDSWNFPVRKALQANYGGSGDGLLACLNAGGTAWNTVTYLGGSGPDAANAIARDAAGNIYITGDTYSNVKSPAGAYGAFVMKMNAAGSSVVFNILLAGSAASSGTAISVDPSGNVWTAGYTAAADFPVTGPPAFGGYFDGFIAKLSPDGSSLMTSGYVGGGGDDRCIGMALTASGEAVVVGATGSTDFPTTNAGAPAAYNAFVLSWRIADTPPAVVSVTPSAGNGTAQKFTVTLTDADGQSDIGTVYFLVNGTAPAGCFVEYYRPLNVFWLRDDAGSNWLSGLTPGVAGTLSNSQCTLDGAGSTVTGNGNTFILQFSLTFRPTYTGAKAIYLDAFDYGGLSTGFQTIGSWTVPGTHAPILVSANPVSGGGSSQVFTATFSDADGQNDIEAVYFLVSGPGAAGCFVEYYRPLNIFWLRDDAGANWLWGLVPGLGGTLSNSECTLDGTTSTVIGSGNTLTIRIGLGFRATYSGLKTIYAVGFDAGGLNTGWQTIGAWSVPGVNHPPALISVTPAVGGGSNQTFAVTLNDADGQTDIDAVYFAINGPTGGACFLEYYRPLNIFWLRDDAGANWLWGLTPGAAGTLSNSQCTLDGTNTTVIGNGNSLGLQISLTFRPAFGGQKTIYVEGFDYGGLNSGWQTAGGWTVR